MSWKKIKSTRNEVIFLDIDVTPFINAVMSDSAEVL